VKLANLPGDVLFAFHAALAAVERVTKAETADMGKYIVKYASLNAVHAEVVRCIELHDMQITQEPTIHEGFFAVRNTLIHKDGSMIEFEPMCLPMPKDAQAEGSATTYLRRYSLVSQFGIAVEDDDGAAATTSAQTAPGRRTEAERLINVAIGNMDVETSREFKKDFKAKFGSGLSDLAANRHGDALTWSKEWQEERERAAAEAEAKEGAEDKADEEFVAEAKGEGEQ